jgi:formate-dependent phosphoribosylglycinamide formyltransferase (GAR transformylase)
VPKSYVIRVGDEYATNDYPRHMKSDPANARKFSLRPDAVLFAIERAMGFVFVDRNENLITLGFVIVPISAADALTMEREAHERWMAMTPEQRTAALTFDSA